MNARLALRTAALLAVLAAAPARASEADAFENKVPPISGQLYPKGGRIELTLGGSLSVNDPFYTKTFGSVKLTYHLSEFVSAGVYGAGGPASVTGSTTICQANQGCTAATEVELRQVPGKIQWMAGAEAAFAPVYGKLGLLSELPVHFDLAVIAGGDWITYQKAVDPQAALAPPGNTSSPGAHVGLGMRFFLANYLALRLEVRDYFYRAEIGLLGKNQLQQQLFMDLGLSFFFPTSVRGP